MHAAATGERVSAAKSVGTPSAMAEPAGASAAVVRRPLSPRKFFAMLYETDTVVAAAAVRRPRTGGAATVTKDVDDDDGQRRPRPAVPAAVAAISHRQQTVATAIVRPAAAYVEHTFSAGLTAFREYDSPKTEICWNFNNFFFMF